MLDIIVYSPNPMENVLYNSMYIGAGGGEGREGHISRYLQDYNIIHMLISQL